MEANPETNFLLVLVLHLNCTDQKVYNISNELFHHHRLHREALKQSATDPLSGKIDVSILITGMSSATRKRRVELAQSLRKLIQAKGKVLTLNFQKLFQEMKDSSDLVS